MFNLVNLNFKMPQAHSAACPWPRFAVAAATAARRRHRIGRAACVGLSVGERSLHVAELSLCVCTLCLQLCGEMGQSVCPPCQCPPADLLSACPLIRPLSQSRCLLADYPRLKRYLCGEGDSLKCLSYNIEFVNNLKQQSMLPQPSSPFNSRRHPTSRIRVCGVI